MNLLILVITAIISAIGGIFIAVSKKFGEGWINEIFEKRKEKRERKFKAAKDINSFCIEGMHKGFRVKAGSIQHIRFRAAEIESIELETGKKLREFIDAWSMCRNILKQGSLKAEDEKLAQEYKDKAQKLGNELLETARNWNK